MSVPAVNQSRQMDDRLSQQAVVLGPGGSAFLVLPVSGAPIERDTDGFAAIALGLVSPIGSSFDVRIYQYPQSGFPYATSQFSSQADPLGVVEIINITRPITNKFISVEVIDTSGMGGIVLCNAKLRPVSCYDMEVQVEFDPGDVLNVKNKLGVTVAHHNGAAGGASQAMFGANANRLEVVGVNLGPDPIHVAFGVAAVWGAGQYVRAGGDFRFDRTSLAINYIDNGNGAAVSATEFATP